MPVPAYMTIEGDRQGSITTGAGNGDSIGGKSREGHEDEIMVQGYEHQIIQPTDVQSGAPTGKRMHKEVRILKQFDGSSPLLLNALTTGEQLKGTIKWFRISPQGDEQHYYTVEIDGAVCTSIEPHMPNCLDENNKFQEHMEWVSFRYRKIHWRHDIMGKEGEDDWKAAGK